MDENTQDNEVDDTLEQQRQDPMLRAVGDEQLREENDMPAAAADDNATTTLPGDHPSQDSDVDSSEKYEGEV